MTFAPYVVNISNITQANPAVVTTNSNHNLKTGQVIRMRIPKNYGMVELNNLSLQITVASATSFSLQYSQSNPLGKINVDSIKFNQFINAGMGTPATITPIGSSSTPISNTQWQIQNKACDSLISDATINYSTSPIPF